MMGKLDKNPVPPWAVQMWATETDIFVALPMTAGGIPYITRYPKSEGGLSAALAVLTVRHPEVPKPTTASPANYSMPPKQPQVQEAKLSAAQLRLREETTESQRANARALLVKLGLKP
jgi:hypothetical protein